MARYTRHQLKEDKFAEAAAQSLSWFAEHEKPLIIATGIAVVILGLLVGAWFWLQRRDTEASVALGAAIRDYQAPIRPAGTPAIPDVTTFASAKERGEKAYDEFVAVTTKYAHTRTATIAKYFAGLAAMDAGRNKDAEQALKEVAGSRDHDLAALARMALASLYRSTNRPQEAIKIYNDLIQHPTDSVPKTAAQLELADLYQPQQPGEAQRIYKQIQTEDPKSPAAQIAAEHLAPAQQ